jgi:hypothetical protein
VNFYDFFYIEDCSFEQTKENDATNEEAIVLDFEGH